MPTYLAMGYLKQNYDISNKHFKRVIVFFLSLKFVIRPNRGQNNLESNILKIIDAHCAGTVGRALVLISELIGLGKNAIIQRYPNRKS